MAKKYVAILSFAFGIFFSHIFPCLWIIIFASLLDAVTPFFWVARLKKATEGFVGSLYP